MVLSMDGNSPWWNSTEPELQQSTLSANLSFKNETPAVKGFQKQLGFNFQEQNSSSTQSTGQSYVETASVDTDHVLSLQSGFSGLQANLEEDQSKSTVSFQDCVFPYPPIDYGQSVCFSHGDQYSHGSGTAYGPYPGVHALIMGPGSTRVPLPFNPLQNEPIYVNAKQYKAILRRRECRAKLDAQNKITRARKPYLHESRHRHAINRARGSGGRFLNKKKLQEDSEGNMEEEGGGGGGRGISNCSLLQFELNNAKGSGSGSSSGLYHQVEDNDQENPYSNHYHQGELRFSIYQTHSDGGTNGGGIQRFVSVVP